MECWCTDKCEGPGPEEGAECASVLLLEKVSQAEVGERGGQVCCQKKTAERREEKQEKGRDP